MKRIIIGFYFLLFFISGFSQFIGFNYLHKTHYDLLEVQCFDDVLIKIKYPAYAYKDSLKNEANSIDLLVNSSQQVLKKLNLNKNLSYEIILEYPISCSGIVCEKKENLNVTVTEIEASINECIVKHKPARSATSNNNYY